MSLQKVSPIFEVTFVSQTEQVTILIFASSSCVKVYSCTHVVQLVVESAGVAEVVAGPVAAPERRGEGAAVHALATLAKVVAHIGICKRNMFEML